MKTTLTIIFLFLSSFLVAQNQLNISTQYNVQGFVNNCLNELKIDSVSINIVGLNKMIDIKYFGKVVNPMKKCYIIYIYECVDFSDFRNILSHELVHIQQFENGMTLDDKVFYMDKIYDKRSDYNDRPYEVEARNIGTNLYYKFKNQY